MVVTHTAVVFSDVRVHLDTTEAEHHRHVAVPESQRVGEDELHRIRLFNSDTGLVFLDQSGELQDSGV